MDSIAGPPMTGHFVLVKRPVAEVFAYAAALERHSEWQPGLLKAEVLSEGPIGIGSVVVETRMLLGRVRRFEYRITGWEPGRLLAFVGTSGRIRPEGTMTFAAEGAATHVGLRIEAKGAGAGRLALRLANRAIERSIDRNLARFKEKLESGSA